MNATGIGASVKRKEDIRFITGKGRYVDDINRPGQAFAYFVRSPHAHATIDKIDASAALASPGVVAVFTGADTVADKIGAHVCGWTINSKDGSPMKVGRVSRRSPTARRAMSAIHVAVVIADTYAQARDARGEARRRLWRAAGGGRSGDRRQAGPDADSRVAPNNTVFNWHLGDKAATKAAFAAAPRIVTKIDLVNNRAHPQRDGAARRGRRVRSGTDIMTLYTTSQNPHVARVVLSAFMASRPSTSCASSRPTSAAASARRSSSMPRRRSAPGRPGRSTARSNGPPTAREAFLTDAHGRDHVTHAELALDASGKIIGLRVHTIANLGAYLSTFCVAGADLPLRDAAVGPIQHPGDLCRGRRGLHQHRAGRRLSRRRPAGGDVRGRAHRREGGARNWAAIPPNSAAQNFITAFPHQTPVVLNYDTGDYAAALDKALELADYKGLAGAQGGLGGEGQAARHRLLRLYRGLRPRAVAGGRLARRAASAVGNRRKCASIRSAPSRC